MEALSCRLLPWSVADGPQNMAADEALLEAAAAGAAALRFYAWEPATLSLGYFQPEAVRHTDPRLGMRSPPRAPEQRRPGSQPPEVPERTFFAPLALLVSSSMAPWGKKLSPRKTR